jgi:hypothetical protein
MGYITLFLRFLLLHFVEIITMAASFTFSNFSVRFLFALILVMLTYNPTDYSFYHLVVEQISPAASTAAGATEGAAVQVSLPLLLMAGIVLSIGWVIFLRATLRSLGPIGISLVAALFGCAIWVLVDLKWLIVEGIVFQYIVLVIVAVVLGVGMSWSHIRRRLSGQADMDDVDQ